MNKLNVQAIFDSIDGEENGFAGAGQLATFIRLKECNLNCHWCDTQYAQKSKPENWMTIDEVVQQVHFLKITISGGEPLLQETTILNLFERFQEKNHCISIETNGSVRPSNLLLSTVIPLVRIVMDFKLPSSGMTNRMNFSAFLVLRDSDIIKFVIADKEDYEYAKKVISDHPDWKARKVFSPMMEIVDDCGFGGKMVDINWPRQLAEMMIKDRVDAQYSLQVHKVLWPGVREER